MIAAIVVHGEVFSWGKGASAKTARVQASEEALKKLDEADLQGLCNCKRGAGTNAAG